MLYKIKLFQKKTLLRTLMDKHFESLGSGQYNFDVFSLITGFIDL